MSVFGSFIKYICLRQKSTIASTKSKALLIFSNNDNNNEMIMYTICTWCTVSTFSFTYNEE